MANWSTLLAGTGVSDHGALSGLADDDHSVYALLLGRSGGTTLIGGTDASDDLLLQSTSNATKGLIGLSSLTTGLIYDEVNDRAGIGIATPDTKLHIWSATAGAVAAAANALLTLESDGASYVSFLGPTNADQGVVYGDVDNNARGWVTYDHSSDALALGTAGNTNGTLTSSGDLRIAAGIAFNGDTAAANHLDDYEEGTFTPTVQDGSRSDAESQTYSSQNGEYTKIGDLCYGSFDVTLTSLGTLTGADTARFAGLPFTPNSFNGTPGGVMISVITNANLSSNQFAGGFVSAGVTEFVLTKQDASGDTSNVLISDISANSIIRVHFMYKVA